MNKKILISIIFIIIAITIIVNYKNKENTNIENKIEKMKIEIGATAPEEMYEIQQEYDGREILTIKPDIQFKTVLTGIIKNSQPTKQDIEKLDLNKFHTGIWISEISRNKFMQILNKCGLENFAIDNDGYLYKKAENNNEYSNKLEALINSEKLTIIDITGTCYIRDEMTGEIVEYPFKDMDLYQICEKYETQGSTIIVVTTNPVDEISIIKEICD